MGQQGIQGMKVTWSNLEQQGNKSSNEYGAMKQVRIWGNKVVRNTGLMLGKSR